MKTSIVKIVTLCAAILIATVLQSQAENRDAVKRWAPAEIGQGAFSLKPDKTIVYKTVDKLGQPAELTLHAFLPEGCKPSDKRPAALFFHGGGWHGGVVGGGGEGNGGGGEGMGGSGEGGGGGGGSGGGGNVGEGGGGVGGGGAM